MHWTRLDGPWRYAAVALAAAFFFLHSAWIPAKAELAQWLMLRCWSQIRAGNLTARPWPWADTRPVAVLEAPRHGVRQLVLEGDSGRNLAFGPALHADAASRDLVISGHRDTHFAFLRDLRPGDVLSLQTGADTRTYAVADIEVVDSERQRLVLEPGIDRLSLVTCYPFDTLTAGGPLRLVVTALPFERLHVQESREPGRRYTFQKHAASTSL